MNLVLSLGEGFQERLKWKINNGLNCEQVEMVMDDFEFLSDQEEMDEDQEENQSN